MVIISIMMIIRIIMDAVFCERERRAEVAAPKR